MRSIRRHVPCLIIDSNGSRKTILQKDEIRSIFMHPIWQCTRWACPIRGQCLDRQIHRSVYEPLDVMLGNIDGHHGVVRCEGGGRSGERK